MTKNRHPVTEYRFKNQLTLKQFARFIESTPAHLSQIENWKVTPGLNMAARIMNATFGAVQLQDLLSEEAKADIERRMKEMET